MGQAVPPPLTTATMKRTMMDSMHPPPAWLTVVDLGTKDAYYYDNAIFGDNDDGNDRRPVLTSLVAPSDC